MDILAIRDELDELDKRIVELFEQRMVLCEKVAAYKVETGKKVLDKEREREKIKSVRALAQNDFNKQGVTELFEQIMAISRKLQYQLLSNHDRAVRLPFEELEEIDRKNATVVFQGADGAYSQAAMQKYFGGQTKSFHVDAFRDAMTALEEGRADYAVLPIENSTAGIVNEIYDLLVEFENYIIGEQIIPIEHCLLGIPGTSLSQIKNVYSHPQSLMQCARYLEGHPDWQQSGMPNNAFAARKVVEDRNPAQAAIAGEHAAGIYNLEVLEKAINHSGSNSTRFIIVSSRKVFLKGAKKVSICFEIPHESGSLYHILSHFIFNNLNMTKIESRPIEGRNWEYRFFVDFEGSLVQSSVRNALRSLREETTNMKILGNY